MTPTTATKATHFDVLVVGAGLSGIGAGHYLQTECPWASYAIFEARVDQSAAVIRRLKWMWASTPDAAAVSLMYWRMESPSAMDFSPSQGRKE